MTDILRVAFIGLGGMGIEMAARLIDAGHQVTVWNRTPSRAEPLVASGARLVGSPADAARDAECIVTMLADDAAVEAVTLGTDGILAAMTPGALHISMSTISPDCAGRLTAAHRGQGSEYLSAPVFGRPDAAARGALFVVAAGSASSLDRALPIFAAVGQRHFVVGDEPRQANVMKLAGNFMIMAATEAMGEAMAVAGSAGVDADAVLEVLTGTLFDTPVYRNYGAMVVKRQFRPAGFTATLGIKDMDLFDESARAGGVPAPLLSIVRDRLKTVVARHGADADWAAVGAVARDATDVNSNEETRSS